MGWTIYCLLEKVLLCHKVLFRFACTFILTSSSSSILFPCLAKSNAKPGVSGKNCDAVRGGADAGPEARLPRRGESIFKGE